MRLSTLRVYGPIYIIHSKKFRCGIGLRLNAAGRITAGRNLTVSSGAKILSTGIDLDVFKTLDRDLDYHVNSEIILGDNVWLGANSIILPGVKLKGPNVVIAAGAVVTKSFNGSNILLAGVPAKVVKRI